MILKIKTRLIIEPVRRSLGETVKWLRHVTEKSRVQVLETASCVKGQGKAAYNTPKWWDPIPDPYVCESCSAPGCSLITEPVN